MRTGLLLGILALGASGCAQLLPERLESTPIATSRCPAREMGWWDGPLTHCRWNRLVREDRGIED